LRRRARRAVLHDDCALQQRGEARHVRVFGLGLRRAAARLLRVDQQRRALAEAHSPSWRKQARSEGRQARPTIPLVEEAAFCGSEVDDVDGCAAVWPLRAVHERRVLARDRVVRHHQVGLLPVPPKYVGALARHVERLDLDASAVELHLDRRRGDHSPRGRLPWRAAGAGSGNSTRQGGGRRGGGPYRGRRQGGGGGGGWYRRNHRRCWRRSSLLWSGRRRGGQLEVAHDEARGQTGAETELGAVIQLLRLGGVDARWPDERAAEGLEVVEVERLLARHERRVLSRDGLVVSDQDVGHAGLPSEDEATAFLCQLNLAHQLIASPALEVK